MARMLGRSKSLRMLRGGHKESHQQESANLAPQPTLSQVDLERLKAATPVSRADGKLETPEMPQRPTTSSGGPGDRGKLFHKKVAPAVVPTTPCSEDQAFVFPFPSPAKSTSTTTILYTAEVRESSEEGIIGIALGSPTMASFHPNASQATDFVTSTQGPFTHISANASHYSIPHNVAPRQEPPKPKLSRWKSLFRKAAPPPPQEKQSFYQLARTVAPARADSHHDNESLDSRATSYKEEDPRAVSPPTFRPEIRESRKLPKGQEQPPVETRPRALTAGVASSSKPRAALPRSASSPKPPPKDVWGKSPNVPQLVVSGSAQVGSPQSTNSGAESLLLDVDIPSVHMERYSVMFSSLLQPNSNAPSSSLLARRQGNSDKLKPLHGLSDKPTTSNTAASGLTVKTKENRAGTPRNESHKSHRRATSPTPSYPKSPGNLSLFPPARSASPKVPAQTVNRPRPLQRSTTAPAVSPSRESFSVSISSKNSANSAPQEPKKEKGRMDFGAMDRVLTPSPTASSFQSYDSDTEEITIVVAQEASAQSWKPRIEEPEPVWEILAKKPSSPTAITKTSALSSHPSSAPLEPPSRAVKLTRSQTLLSPGPRSADVKLHGSSSQATVGIARSVSVSRATRTELKRPTLARTATDNAERLVDKKPLTPTLVELKNRKSQRVQLVEA